MKGASRAACATIGLCLVVCPSLLARAEPRAPAPPEPPLVFRDAEDAPESRPERERPETPETDEDSRPERQAARAPRVEQGEPPEPDEETPREGSSLEVTEAEAEADVAPPPEEPCLSESIRVERLHGHPKESAELSLTHCDGAPHFGALVELSLLARDHGAERPAAEAMRRFAEEASEEERRLFVAEGIRRLDPGLLTRLGHLVAHLSPEAIVIVSGHRPHTRPTSRHFFGAALDVELVGVSRDEVAERALDLEATGVGYYPNSTFTHLDVRREAYSWMDVSGPGERSRYRPWPEEDEDRPTEGDVAPEETMVSSASSAGGDAISAR